MKKSDHICILCKGKYALTRLNDNKSWLCEGCKMVLENHIDSFGIIIPQKPQFIKKNFLQIFSDKFFNENIGCLIWIIILILHFVIKFDLNAFIILLPLVGTFLIIAIPFSFISAIKINKQEYRNFQTRLSEYKKYELFYSRLNLLQLKHSKLVEYIYDYWPDYPPDWRLRRRAILKRDQEKCTKCHSSNERWNPLHIHHIKKLRNGGSNKPDNLITLCKNCHSKEPGHEHMLLNDLLSI